MALHLCLKGMFDRYEAVSPIQQAFLVSQGYRFHLCQNKEYLLFLRRMVYLFGCMGMVTELLIMTERTKNLVKSRKGVWINGLDALHGPHWCLSWITLDSGSWIACLILFSTLRPYGKQMIGRGISWYGFEEPERPQDVYISRKVLKFEKDCPPRNPLLNCPMDNCVIVAVRLGHAATVLQWNC